ncbi:hypothetical protein PHSY_002386 [Pseudozyma hubeiensis SY62]|uniref:Uncharacterized protein n=1 Tax=Pseudozyma hubeiensis (strain SY62) TaxID=1305764 RepID=R9P0S1_PSEHS|nr:hypothetical protein PHSY_002386 [Pseudozyma hubeiensis SY62]GAC94813.1 hypothetical protein PHSY_002386 [Pseudozyma hubeiensis SY62]
MANAAGIRFMFDASIRFLSKQALEPQFHAEVNTRSRGRTILGVDEGSRWQECRVSTPTTDQPIRTCGFQSLVERAGRDITLHATLGLAHLASTAPPPVFDVLVHDLTGVRISSAASPCSVLSDIRCDRRTCPRRLLVIKLLRHHHQHPPHRHCRRPRYSLDCEHEDVNRRIHSNLLHSKYTDFVHVSANRREIITRSLENNSRYLNQSRSLVSRPTTGL